MHQHDDADALALNKHQIYQWNSADITNVSWPKHMFQFIATKLIMAWKEDGLMVLLQLIKWCHPGHKAHADSFTKMDWLKYGVFIWNGLCYTMMHIFVNQFKGPIYHIMQKICSVLHFVAIISSAFSTLTHWCRVMHICISKLTSIG